jgi:glucan-binding YG repeat protein
LQFIHSILEKIKTMAKKKYYNKNTNEEIQDMENEESTATGKMKIETVLLGVIALALVIQTFYMISGNSKSSTPTYIPPQSQNMRSNAQQNIQPQAQQPTNNPVNITTNPQGNQNQPVQINQNQPQQQQANPNATTISLSESSVDFGTLTAADKKQHTFTVTNTGSQALSYAKVYGDPGITIESYPTQPIPPGGTGQIKFSFDPSQVQKATGSMQSFNIHMDGNSQPSHVHFTIQAAVKQ